MMNALSVPRTKPVIQFDGVTFHRGKRRLFEGLSLDLGDSTRGSVTALVGISGIGKSTFLRMVARLEKPTSGRIEVTGDAASISFLSQEPVIFEHLSAQDNALYLLQARRQALGPRFARLVSDLRLDRILNGPALVSSLSGGERQRLAILRALSTDPTILLLDEPCAGLDPALRGSVIDGLQRAIAHSSATVLYVTHHIDEIALSSDRVLFFEKPREATGAVKLFLNAAEDFLDRPPTLDSAKFALFPRCNVVRGHIRGEQFAVGHPGDANCESIAFLPTQAQLVAASNSLTMPWAATRRGGNVWLELHGESITVSSPGDENAFWQPTIRILPGALVYDVAGLFQRVLDNPLHLIRER